MKKFHITWFNYESDLYSKGETFDADNEINAITEWRSKFPHAIFISCISCDLIKHS
jgi:hypothetical protein